MEKFNFGNYISKAKNAWNNEYECQTYAFNIKTHKPTIGIYCRKKDQYGREHGLFWKDSWKHLQGKQGCPKCSKHFRMNTQYLIETSKFCHNSQFDNLTYEKTIFQNYSKPIIVTCHNKYPNGLEHGDFQIKPGHLLQGEGCPICRYIKSADSKRRTLNEVIEIANNIHNFAYDYSLITDYQNDRTVYPIRYKKHDIVFKMTMNNHIKGKQGCPLCGKERAIAARQLTNEDFKERAAIKHNNFYIYDTTDVNNRDEQGKVLIRCPKHGLFRQTPGNHLMGQGCPICRQSTMEKEIALLLQENNIDYIQQHTFKWLKHQRKLRLDFFLPSFNIAIECQGIQHFEEEHFGSTHDQNILPTIQFLDKLKLDLCSKHNITMIYYANYQYDFPYEVITDKANIITKIKNHTVKN